MSAFLPQGGAASRTTTTYSSGGSGACSAVRALRAIPGLHPRGGASITKCSNGMLLLFGGADREASHFNDLWVQESVKGGWRQVECSGDVPMPRSGHSADCYGPYVFVFGGMNAAKGAVFNDLYVLDTASWRWYYVGEAGEEISARNSHSSAVLRVSSRDDNADDGSHYLVIFGGASLELGPLGDTYLAKLPRLEDITDLRDLYVTWERLEAPIDATPCPREMQAGCRLDARRYHAIGNTANGGARSGSSTSSLLITGGRDREGQVLSDIWALSYSRTNTTASGTTDGDNNNTGCVREGSWGWQRLDVELPDPLCSHVAYCYHHDSISTIAAATEGVAGLEVEGGDGYDAVLVVYGGFTGELVSDRLRWTSIDVTSTFTSNPSTSSLGRRVWTAAEPPALHGLEPRFGSSVCEAPAWLAASAATALGIASGMQLATPAAPPFSPSSAPRTLPSSLEVVGAALGHGSGDVAERPPADAAVHTSSSSVLSSTATSVAPPSASSSGAFVLFGGINDRQDFGDVWVIAYSPPLPASS